jgi:hypothetical protein
MNLKIGLHLRCLKDIQQLCLYMKECIGNIKIILVLTMKDYKVSNMILDFFYYYI